MSNALSCRCTTSIPIRLSHCRVRQPPSGQIRKAPGGGTTHCPIRAQKNQTTPRDPFAGSESVDRLALERSLRCPHSQLATRRWLCSDARRRPYTPHAYTVIVIMLREAPGIHSGPLKAPPKRLRDLCCRREPAFSKKHYLLLI